MRSVIYACELVILGTLYLHHIMFIYIDTQFTDTVNMAYSSPCKIHDYTAQKQLSYASSQENLTN